MTRLKMTTLKCLPYLQFNFLHDIFLELQYLWQNKTQNMFAFNYYKSLKASFTIHLSYSTLSDYNKNNINEWIIHIFQRFNLRAVLQLKCWWGQIKFSLTSLIHWLILLIRNNSEFTKTSIAEEAVIERVGNIIKAVV